MQPAPTESVLPPQECGVVARALRNRTTCRNCGAHRKHTNVTINGTAYQHTYTCGSTLGVDGVLEPTKRCIRRAERNRRDD
jgi:hypothetical protein